MRSAITVLICILSNSALAEDTPLPVPSDPKARYFIVERGGTQALPTLVTKRVGPSGTSYTKRLFDCKGRTFKYLAEGDTLAELNRPAPSAAMSSLVEGSISYHVWVAACRRSSG